MEFKIDIDQSVMNSFHFTPNPDFGSCQLPVVLSCPVNRRDTVFTPDISNKTHFNLSYFTSALHYGLSIFEGLKAYKQEDGRIGVFRLNDHARRFQNSAKIMGMPELDPEMFKSCIKKYIECVRDLIPDIEEHSLYLRPLMFASDPIIKVRTGDDFRFVIMASIVGSYFVGGKTGVKLLCNKELIRAFPHGTGEAKTAANYAISLPDLRVANSLGLEQVLYLDSQNKQFVEELGGMNFFMLKEGKLYTPKLKGTILHGITRDSVIKIATSIGLEILEEDININDILYGEGVQGLFACGTAATLVPILEIGYQEKIDGELKSFKFKDHPLFTQIRDCLIHCHLGKHELSKEWLTLI